MARYTGPMTKKSRRLGVDLVGGDAAFERRPYPPGQHGRARIKESEYRTQLQEKQKARFTYGVMEKQFRKYYEEANRQSGKTGENLLQILESRLDNVVYRAGLARTRRMARQLVSHGHFTVNGVRVNVPSYRVSQYDIIDVRDKSVNTIPFQIAGGFPGDLERNGVHRLIPNIDDVVLRHPVARNVHANAVDGEVAVADQLAGHPAGTRQTSAVHHVVQAALQDLQQVLAGLTRLAVRLFVVLAELLLHDAVGEASLLLLLQLRAVFAFLDPRATVLAG